MSFFLVIFELPQPPSPNLTVPAVVDRGLVCVADAAGLARALHREKQRNK